MRGPSQIDRGYPSRTWAKGADRAAYLAEARKCYPNASAEQIEDFARVLSTLDVGTKSFIPDSQVEAEELAFTRAIPHVVHGMAIIDRNAA